MSIDLAAIGRSLHETDSGFWVGDATTDLHYDAARSLHWREAEDASGWHQHRAGVVADVVARFPASGEIFDIGGGNGFVTRALVAAGTPAVLVEPVEEAARTAYERGLRPVVCATTDAARFAPGSLPAAGMFDVLEHIEDDVEALRSLRTALAPGGRLYLTVPKHQWLWSSHDEDAGHQRRYSTRALIDVVGAAGFTVEYCTSFFSVLLPPMVVRRILPGRNSSNGGVRVIDPTSGEGAVARTVRSLLSHERRSLAKRARHTGTSILLVARSPGASAGATA